MSSPTFRHTPVLLDETLQLLGPSLGEGKVVVDCTAGGGGHIERMLGTGSAVIAIDRDQAALSAVRERFGAADRLVTVHADFRSLESVLQRVSPGRRVDAVLADLGVSSHQLQDRDRGFSFRDSGPLDMRMDRTSGEPLLERLSKVTDDELARVIRDFGEEARARRIAHAVLAGLRKGELTDTLALAAIVSRAVGGKRGRGSVKIHPATRTFQALRIWVNEELESLDVLLEALPRVLAPSGRAGIISFHSLEDRRVKTAFAALSASCTCPPALPICRCTMPGFSLVTRRAVKPTEEEARSNPRSRSARLRVINKLAEQSGAANEHEGRLGRASKEEDHV